MSLISVAAHTPSSSGGAFWSPVRVGSLKVEKLRVIDTYGQIFDIPFEEMKTENFAHSIRLGSTVVPALPPSFRLQPRFCRLCPGGISAQDG